ncbi:MAG: PQQ-binding-like beta-propeller repeat protein [Verrucomicrobiota bacterium]|jgi:outer membrane protein assembly factor BamB
MAQPDFVFIGLRGSVVAIDQRTGTRVWETKLKGGTFVTLLAEDGSVFAGTQGEIFCLNATTGEILWHDALKGYGFGLICMATKNGSAAGSAVAAEQEREQSDASSATGAVAASS